MGRYSKTKTITKGESKITYSTVWHKEKRDKSPLMKSLVKTFFTSLKKNNVFGDFIASYKPFNKALEDDLILPTRIAASVSQISIGDIKIIRQQELVPSLHPYETFVGRLFLLNELIKPKLQTSTYNHKFITRSNLLNYYAEEELKKRNVKVYPNNLVFAFTLGTVFAIIGYIIFMVMIGLIFGLVGCIIYAFFVLLTTLIGASNI